MQNGRIANTSKACEIYGTSVWLTSETNEVAGTASRGGGVGERLGSVVRVRGVGE